MTTQELIDHAKMLLANTSGNEPWAVYKPDDGPDVFDGYSLWHDDGDPGVLYIAKGFEQGHDDGKGDAEFAAAAPTLVRALIEALESTLPEVPDCPADPTHSLEFCEGACQDD